MTAERRADERRGLAPNGEFIVPDQADATCPVLLKKIFRFRRRANHLYKLAPSCPERGALRNVINVGCGMRWTLWRRKTGGAKRTAKSCGPDAPTLASSWPRCFRIVACDGG